MAAVARCLGAAALACLLTRPLFHVPPPTGEPKRTGAPVSVTADISRRLSSAGTDPAEVSEERVLWAGVE